MDENTSNELTPEQAVLFADFANQKTGKVLARRIDFVVRYIQDFGTSSDIITSKQIKELVAKYMLSDPFWLHHDKANMVEGARATYRIPNDLMKVAIKIVTSNPNYVQTELVDPAGGKYSNVAVMPLPQTTETAETFSEYVPEINPLYVPFGNYFDIESIIKARVFYPAYIVGNSGNGKTFSVEQACAKLGREYIRANVTAQTEEADLVGGFRLISGETVWVDGPAIIAMERGAILLFDEVDLAREKFLCMQPVLEGKGIFIKKINRYVKPKPGFNIFATANTKGKGSDDGRFIGTNVQNEALLERFAITLEQDYPPETVEKQILKKAMAAVNIFDEQFIERLVKWAGLIRQTHKEGGIDETMSTRRLVHIGNAYAIFGCNRLKAIEVCVARFDGVTKSSMVDFYTKVDENCTNVERTKSSKSSTPKTQTRSTGGDDETPF